MTRARKTFSVERDGIWTGGHGTKPAAEAHWRDLRDTFVRNAASGPWVFRHADHVLVVAASASGWQYTLSRAERPGVVQGTCYFSAPNQVAAIAVGIGSLAQLAWSRAVPDDAVWFDALAQSARLRADEVKHERDNFLTVAARWRACEAVAVA